MPTSREPTPSPDLTSATDLARTRAFASVLQTVADGIVVADRDGRLLVVNEAAERILGVGLLDVPPQAWTRVYGLFLPDRLTPCPTERLPLMRALQGETVRDVELFVRRPGWTEGRMIRVSANPWRDESGDVLGGVAVFRDVTQQAAAGEMVRRLSHAVEQTTDAIYITDRDGTIEYVNPGFERMTGYTRAEVLGRTPRVLRSGHHDPTHYRELWETLLDGRVYRGTMVNRRKNGEIYYAEMTVTPIKDLADTVTHFVAVGKDMTDRRARLEQDLELDLARSMQRRLFPAHPPRIPGFDMAAEAHSAAATCGDYFDFIESGTGQLSLVIGDVSGHGLGPALVMSQTRAYLRACLETLAGPGEALRALNRSLVADLEPGRFVTMLLARLDPHTRTLWWANAGHPPGLVLSAAGQLRATLDSSATPLGVSPAWGTVDGEPIVLEPGDILVLFTDGISESLAADGRLFGTEGVLAAVRAHLAGSAQQMLDGLIAAARSFSRAGPSADDHAAIVCKVAPGR